MFRWNLFLAVGVAFGCAVASLSGASFGGFEYASSSGLITITKYTGRDEVVHIPDMIEGRPVVSVGEDSFYGRRDLVQVTIGGNVESIGQEAFYQCVSLGSVVWTDELESIGDRAFLGCTSLGSVTIGPGLTSIGSQAFAGCTALRSIEVSDLNPNYSSLNGVLFDKDQTMLIQYSGGDAGAYVIPDSVREVGDWAFRGFSGLTSVTIPEGVAGIGESAFSLCPNLTRIDVSELNSAFSSVDGVLFSNDQSVLILYPGRGTGAYSVPEGTTVIGDDAFYGCTGLTRVEIPVGVTHIGENAFLNCTGLTSMEFPSSLTMIGWLAFRGCINLSSVTFPESLTLIDGYAFSGCEKLAGVTLPAGLVSIGHEAFGGCHGLTSITLPESVGIAWGAFNNCSNLSRLDVSPLNPDLTSIDGVVYDKSLSQLRSFPCGYAGSFSIPDHVTMVSGQAFKNCPKLTGLTIGENIDDFQLGLFKDFTGSSNLARVDVSPSNSHFRSVDGVLISKSMWNDLIRCPPGFQGAFVIPDYVTLSEQGAFMDCTGLTHVTIGAGMESIGSFMFYGCSSLTDVVIPDNIVYIDDWAFKGCSSLTEVAIPQAVKVIRSDAFASCDSLTRIDVHPLNTQYSSIDGVLFDKSQTILKQCPGGFAGVCSLPETVSTIEESALQECGNLVGFDVHLLNPNFSSIDGVLFDKTQTTLLRSPGARQGEYRVPAGVTKIDRWAFANNRGLTRVTIGGEVSGIGPWAFRGCEGLTGLYFEGDAPLVGVDGFDGAPEGLVVYYRAGTSGWGDTLAGRPTALWGEVPAQVQLGAPWYDGVGFSFSIAGPSNGSVVIEACEDRVTSEWQQIGSTVLDEQGTGGFVDSDWTSYPARFYRVRMNAE
ncbi:MAG: leucine-rich repeat domain-containing protein [Verrucomicrobiota bacterium]|nr:leucine-rich repeat domain-containing protein [Verrucomicrobiota bacterium]